MEQMYTMGLDIHAFGAFLLLSIVVVNLMMLMMSHHILRYAKRMRIMMPLSSTLIALLIFTGAVMMAAKHLHFSLENIIMIVLSVVMIILEAKRYKTLKRRTDISQEAAFGQYKRIASRYLLIEIVLLGAISGWMMV